MSKVKTMVSTNDIICRSIIHYVNTALVKMKIILFYYFKPV